MAAVTRPRRLAQQSPAAWVRPGRTSVRPELSNDELTDAVQCHHYRRGLPMTEVDQRTLDELHIRAWGWTDFRHRRVWSVPSWAHDLLIPRNRFSGYGHFLGLLLAAHRAGATGVYISYAEACGTFGCVMRTWGRWVREWERLGLVTTTHTWRARGDGGTGREYGRLLYRLGPAWELRAGPAVLEGATSAGTPTEARMADRCALGLRRAAQRVRDERLELELGRQARKPPREVGEAASIPPPRARTRKPISPPSPPGGDEAPPPSPGAEVPEALAPLALLQQAPPAGAAAPVTAPTKAGPEAPAPAAAQLEARRPDPVPSPRFEAERPRTARGPQTPLRLAPAEPPDRAAWQAEIEKLRPELERFGVRLGAPADLPGRRPRARAPERPDPCPACRGSGLETWGRVCEACRGTGAQ